MLMVGLMRALFFSLLVLAGCGNSDSGNGPSSQCLSIEQQMLTVANANASCTQDSDCNFAYDISDVGPASGCDVFYNDAGATQMTALMQQFSDAGCRSGCLALMARCNMGRCGGPTP